MKSRIGLIAGVFVLLSFTSYHHKILVPPGTVQITQNFFADEMEVSNRSWQEFEYWTKIKYGYHSKEHLETLPDTLVWRNVESKNEPYVIYYYRHPAYQNFPVVGISYEQALAFCKWRTERVKEFYSLANKKDLDITYRLPTKEEWEFLSISSSSALRNGGKDEKNHARLNCAREAGDSVVRDKRNINGKYPDVTAPVNFYAPNRFGLHNCLGNVSEMILEKGISKGGGWLHAIEECRVGKDITYAKANAWLGFRCVCVLKK
ncbi:MAG: SUMF1/EgtB/PvdO family nonheme iron enzyme [bacterium]|nr:SUMF1/EgtB/PvdO family nonheme iron enzyme [bacterium]